MRFIVIEDWENLSSPQVCLTEDGETQIFTSLAEANEFAEDCQEGVVLPLSNDLMKLLKDTAEYVDVLKFESMNENDEDGIERRLWEHLNDD